MSWNPTHIQVAVQRARGLIAKGKSGTNDVFVTIALPKEKYQTTLKEKVADPEWYEECDLVLPDKYEECSVELVVHHRNGLGIDEFLGRADLPLRNYSIHDPPRSQWYSLLPKPGHTKNMKRGELEVRLCYIVSKSKDPDSISTTSSASKRLKIGSKMVKGAASALGEKLHVKKKEKTKDHIPDLTGLDEGVLDNDDIAENYNISVKSFSRKADMLSPPDASPQSSLPPSPFTKFSPFVKERNDGGKVSPPSSIASDDDLAQRLADSASEHAFEVGHRRSGSGAGGHEGSTGNKPNRFSLGKRSLMSKEKSQSVWEISNTKSEFTLVNGPQTAVGSSKEESDVYSKPKLNVKVSSNSALTNQTKNAAGHEGGGAKVESKPTGKLNAGFKKDLKLKPMLVDEDEDEAAMSSFDDMHPGNGLTSTPVTAGFAHGIVHAKEELMQVGKPSAKATVSASTALTESAVAANKLASPFDEVAPSAKSGTHGPANAVSQKQSADSFGDGTSGVKQTPKVDASLQQSANPFGATPASNPFGDAVAAIATQMHKSSQVKVSLHPANPFDDDSPGWTETSKSSSVKVSQQPVNPFEDDEASSLVVSKHNPPTAFVNPFDDDTTKLAQPGKGSKIKVSQPLNPFDDDPIIKPLPFKGGQHKTSSHQPANPFDSDTTSLAEAPDLIRVKAPPQPLNPFGNDLTTSSRVGGERVVPNTADAKMTNFASISPSTAEVEILDPPVVETLTVSLVSPTAKTKSRDVVTKDPASRKMPASPQPTPLKVQSPTPSLSTLSSLSATSVLMTALTAVPPPLDDPPAADSEADRDRSISKAIVTRVALHNPFEDDEEVTSRSSLPIKSSRGAEERGSGNSVRRIALVPHNPFDDDEEATARNPFTEDETPEHRGGSSLARTVATLNSSKVRTDKAQDSPGFSRSKRAAPQPPPSSSGSAETATEFTALSQELDRALSIAVDADTSDFRLSEQAAETKDVSQDRRDDQNKMILVGSGKNVKLRTASNSELPSGDAGGGVKADDSSKAGGSAKVGGNVKVGGSVKERASMFSLASGMGVVATAVSSIGVSQRSKSGSTSCDSGFAVQPAIDGAVGASATAATPTAELYGQLNATSRDPQKVSKAALAAGRLPGAERASEVEVSAQGTTAPFPGKVKLRTSSAADSTRARSPPADSDAAHAKQLGLTAAPMSPVHTPSISRTGASGSQFAAAQADANRERSVGKLPELVCAEEDSEQSAAMMMVESETQTVEVQDNVPPEYRDVSKQLLVEMVLKMKTQLKAKEGQVRDLEEYIDHLLLRVMDGNPTLLQTSDALNAKNNRR